MIWRTIPVSAAGGLTALQTSTVLAELTISASALALSYEGRLIAMVGFHGIPRQLSLQFD
jgi:hypothetical protein